MNSIAAVTGKKRKIEVFVDNSGNLSEHSLRGAFLLENDVPIVLSMMIDGKKIYLNRKEIEKEQFYFVLPEEWKKSELELHWDEDRRSRLSTLINAQNNSRPASPYHHVQDLDESAKSRDEELFKFLSPLLYYMPKNQPALDDGLQSEIFDGRIFGGCVTSVSPKLAITYRHRSHLKLRLYSEEKEDKNSIVIIRNTANPDASYKMKIVYIDEGHDMVLLSFMSSLQCFNNFPGRIRPPNNFDWLLGLGLSHGNDDGMHITCHSGRICSLKPDDRGRIKVDVVIDGGDSGTPCFSMDRNLIGMMVSSRTSSLRVSTKYVQSEVKDGIMDASCHPGETLIVPGSIILEKIKRYRIKCGEVKSLPETNLLPSRNVHKKRKINERGEPSYLVAETLKELVIDDDEKNEYSTESDDI